MMGNICAENKQTKIAVYGNFSRVRGCFSKVRVNFGCRKGFFASKFWQYPKKRGKNTMSVFLDVFDPPESESGLRIPPNSLICPPKKLPSLIVWNCTKGTPGEYYNFGRGRRRIGTRLMQQSVKI
jgi:hypothetical protein